MNRVGSELRNSPLARLLIVALLIVVGLLYFAWPTTAAVVPRSILISDSRPSVAASYTLAFTLSAPETLGSIKLQFCANSPLFNDPCVAPSGFDVSSATLASQSGETGFSIYAPGTNANTIVLSRTPSASPGGSVIYVLDNVMNPSAVGSFFGRLQTFPTNDASGAENEHGGIAMSLSDTVQISTTVPPYLLFCGGVVIGGFDCANASGNYIDFGNLTSSSTASATSQLLTATNAASGFGVTVFGQTMTSGNNIINPLDARDVSRQGVSQFGMNLVANATPSVGSNPQGTGTGTPTTNYGLPDLFKFTSGDTIATASSVDDFRKFTVSYVINITNGQPVGVYSTTLTYVCLANF